MVSPSAYFVVYHGSRDPRPAHQAKQLAEHMAGCISTHNPQPTPLTIAPLECCDTPLHQRLIQFGQQVVQQGIDHIYVMPLFLLAGVHVRDDIPEEVSVAQQALGDRPRLTLCPYLGSHPRLADYLADYLRALMTPPDRRANADSPEPLQVLVSHGSRRPGGNRVIEAIAQEIQARPAYWSVEPGLDAVLDPLLNDSTNRTQAWVNILPYFLFSGGITDAIAETVESYQQRCPQVQIRLAPPLGANRAIAQMAVDLAALSTASSNSESLNSELSNSESSNSEYIKSSETPASLCRW